MGTVKKQLILYILSLHFPPSRLERLEATSTHTATHWEAHPRVPPPIQEKTDGAYLDIFPISRRSALINQVFWPKGSIGPRFSTSFGCFFVGFLFV